MQLLTARQVAEMLSVSIRTVHNLRRRGHLEAVAVPGCGRTDRPQWRFQPDVIEQLAGKPSAIDREELARQDDEALARLEAMT